MHKQLLLFHNAIAAYFSGNSTLLEATIKQFSVSYQIFFISSLKLKNRINFQIKSPNSTGGSWLENWIAKATRENDDDYTLE